MSTKKQIDDNLLAAYIDGRATPEEENRIMETFKESHEEAKVYLLATQAVTFIKTDEKKEKEPRAASHRLFNRNNILSYDKRPDVDKKKRQMLTNGGILTCSMCNPIGEENEQGEKRSDITEDKQKSKD